MTAVSYTHLDVYKRQGTGKTAAFMLPILQRLTRGPLRQTRVLIIAPTRELAEQIHQSANVLGRHTKVRSAAIYGGVGKGPQLSALQRGTEIIVACPGRLRVDDLPTLVACFSRWPREKLIALHAERQSVAVAIGLAATYDRPIHIVHVSRREEIELIADAKGRGLPVTCEVSPHHLFLTEADAARLGALGDMRPLLGTADDVVALWAHLNDTRCV